MNPFACTPWFPRSIKPVRRGLYEVRFRPTRAEFYWLGETANLGKVSEAWWNGKRWTTNGSGLETLWPLPDAWRGLARKP